MKSNTFTQQKIEETLNSLDGISRAEVAPFFYTRLQGRLISSTSKAQPFWMIITRPAISLITLSLLVILNITTINYFVKSNRQTSVESNTGIQNFANEYDLTLSSIYNENTNKQ